MTDALKKLRIIAQVQASLLRSAGHRLVRGAILLALALVFALSAIAIFNLSAFGALEQAWGSLEAGLFVGTINLLLAGTLAHVATGTSRERDEERLAREITEMTLASLGQDLSGARDEFREISDEVRHIGSSIATVTHVVSGPVAFLLRTLGSELHGKQGTHAKSHKSAED